MTAEKIVKYKEYNIVLTAIKGGIESGPRKYFKDTDK